VLNEELAEITVNPKGRCRPKVSVRYSEAVPFRTAVAYRGGAIVVDDFSASFIHLNTYPPVFRLFDTFAGRLDVERGQELVTIEASKDQAESLHQHPGKITCAARWGNVVVTCDDIGFINRWRLEVPRSKS
jgi:hypothetical protein